MTFLPLAASAQFTVSNPGQIAFDLSEQLQNNARTKAEGALVGALASIAINLLNYASTLVAQSTAEWIATGGAGKHPLFNRETAGQIGESISATFTSEIIDEIIPGSSLLAQFGIDPDNPDVTGLLRNFLSAPYTNNINQIDGTEIGKNFGAYFASVSSIASGPEEATARVLSDMANSVSANEFHGFLKLYGQTRAQANAAAGLGQLQNVFNAGFVDLLDPISQKVRYPAQLVKGEFTSNLEQAKQSDNQTGQALIAAAGKDALIQVGINFATTFISTLFGGLTQRLFDGFFSDIDAVTFNPFDPNRIDAPGGREGIFSSLTTFRPIAPIGYSLLSELATCPASLINETRGIYTCAIDSSFASALARAESGAALTVREAVEENYISGNWPLIGPQSAVNSNPDCRQRAFCHSNLQKLRKARIVPIGWEIAAQKSGTGRATLQEVMDNFYNCGEDGTAPSEWCGLIDPNWILKAPETQCRTLAYGQTLAASGTANRAEECVDIQTCIAEGEDGQCLGGYGYCLQEENVWRFRGTSCPVEYASCRSFTNTSGENVSYLTNTTDSENCGPDAVGCQWRATEKTEGEDGSFDWPVISNIQALDSDPQANKYALFTNEAVQSCDSSEAGCSELVVRTPVQALNRIFNDSFETINTDNEFPLGWRNFGNGARIVDDARQGSVAVQPGGPGSGMEQYGVGLRQGYDYTLSFYAKNGGSSGATVSVEFVDEFADVSEERENNPNFLGLTTISLTDDTFCQQSGDGYTFASDKVLGDEYERFSCRFTVPTFETGRSLALTTVRLFGQAIIDNVVLEQSPVPTVVYSGYLDTQDAITAKIAPDYLGCTGAQDDPEACSNYARVCSPADAGCSLYTPRNGDPEVTGIIGQNDLCPQECSGYDAYRQEPTLYEPQGEFPVNFIASTADQCSANAVGCDEFTNIVTEERSYFTYLRACTEPEAGAIDETGAVFYTWEGSDTVGFQLRTWNLLPSNVPTIVGSGNVFAPCSQWVVESTNGNERIACADSATATSAACDERSDIFTNPDCREFYDVGGNIFYREWSKTVTVTDECNRYRKTTLSPSGLVSQESICTSAGGYFDTVSNECTFFGYVEESIRCSESENGCRLYTGGRSANSRTVFEDIFESGSLSNWSVDGTADYSSESLANTGASMLLENAIASVAENRLNANFAANRTYTLSFIAKGNPGDSIRAGIDLRATPGDGEIEINLTNGDVELSTEWEQYTFGPFDLNEFDYPTFDASANFVLEGSGYIDNIVLRAGQDSVALIRDSWTTPASCDLNSAGQFAPGFHLGCSEYATAAGDSVFLKSFSRLCEEDAVGCSPYFDTFESDSPHGAVYNGYCEVLDTDPATGELIPSSGSTACHLAQSTGGGSYDETSDRLCTIMNGQTSCQFTVEYPLAGVNLEGAIFSHIRFGLDTEVVPGDIERYLIIDATNLCDAGSAGCTEVGLPSYSFDKNTITGFATEYLINDPDAYGESLCSSQQLFCSEFNAGSDGMYYFKDPQGQTCEYRDDIVVNGRQYKGWFREGTTEFCYGTGVCSGDAAVNGNACSLDSDCKVTAGGIGTGTCSESGSSCAQDADCSIVGESCEGVSSATCQITNPTYLIAGVESGIWRNGDFAYEGTVGMCEPSANACTEFLDVLDYDRSSEYYGQEDPERYTFIDNEQLSEGALLASQRCNGQVSVREGCTLFRDTNTLELTANASATDILSQYADDILGERPDALVNPVDCSSPSTSTIRSISGVEVDLCANRCVYDNIALSNIGGQQSSAAFELANPSRVLGIDAMYAFDGSCFTNTDCSVKYSQSGEPVNGRCLSEVPIINESLSVEVVDVPRLTNDTNRVMKVNRDRQCAEWATCRQTQQVWDENSGSYRTICVDLALCTEYSQTGDQTFCSKWEANDPAIILDENRYRSRDTSWYGEEYAGYAIPEQFPLHKLSQILVSAEYVCMPTDGRFVAPEFRVPCGPLLNCANPTDECVRNTFEEYALGYDAGSCGPEGSFTFTKGPTCTIGYCSDNGSACSSNDECANANCVTGVCHIPDPSASACTQDSDCSAGFFCGNDGQCKGTTGEYCDLAGSCSTQGATCTRRSTVISGSCLNSSCVVTASGTPFDSGTSYEQVECRAHPEANAPFGNQIVDQWVVREENANGTFESSVVTNPENYKTAEPYSFVGGYQGVNTCAAGEDCECSYTKVSSSGGQVKYLSADNNVDAFAITVAEALGEPSITPELGICSGGASSGAFCVIDVGTGNEFGCKPQNADAETLGGECTRISREEDILGLKGFCLERDSGLIVEGNQDKGACLTWYPVDQIKGETNLYAKFKSAGYFEDTFHCGEVGLTSDQQAFRGCAARRGDTNASATTQANNDNECFRQIVCPQGYFAIAGAAQYNPNEGASGETNLCNSNEGDGGGDQVGDLWGRGQNACPYMCIPENATIRGEGEGSGESCRAYVEALGSSWQKRERTSWPTVSYSTEFFFRDEGTNGEGIVDYATVAEILQNCVEGQLPISNVADFDRQADLNNSNESGAVSFDYSTENPKYTIYPICTNVIQSAGVNDVNTTYAWTDRLRGPNNAHSFTVAGTATRIFRDTLVAPFGGSFNPKDNSPLIPAYCQSDVELTGMKFIDEFFYPDGFAAWNDGCPSVGSGIGTRVGTVTPDVILARALYNWFARFPHYEGLDDTGVEAVGDVRPAGGSSPEQVKNGLSTIFARAIRVFEWNDDSNRYVLDPSGSDISNFNDFDQGINTLATGSAPQVYKVDLANSKGRNAVQSPIEGVTIAQATGGSEDVTADSNTLKVDMHFFVEADPNQLPIRQILVDWGDGNDAYKGTAAEDNFYKNYLGLDPGTQEPLCDGSNWGRSSEACESGYLTFSNVYSCNPVIAARADNCGDLSGAAGDENRFCVENIGGVDYCRYRPRVHVRDQWGWCTGTCTLNEGLADGDRCFDQDRSILPAPNSECNYNYGPGERPAIDPWVYYDGYIRVPVE